MAGQVGLFARDFDDHSIIRELLCSPESVLVLMPYIMQQTHSGRMFFANFYNATLGAGSNLDLLVVTRGITTPHLAVMVDIGGAGTLSIYEDVTTSNDGTTVGSFNANRQSTKVSTATVTHTPTVSATGTTLMLNHYIPGGTTGNSVGGSSTDFARVTELVLKASSKYLFRLNNLGAGAVGASMQLGWFEDV